jgi:cell wall-associated NlpC family hydrolase
LLSASTVRIWLGSTTLAGLILVGSLPSLASTQPEAICTPMKPILVASTIVPMETYTNVVRKQLQWNPNPGMTEISTGTASESEKQTPSNAVAVAAQTKKPINTSTKHVQAMEASNKQVSRSNSSGLVEHALSLQGVSYAFGGTSRRGFDCSGYTQYVFKGSGISLPRTASEQFKVGSSVSRGQLQTGDLVFFHTYAPGASHVGIYIGGGRFVHASNSGVRTSNLSDSYYAGRYLGARRI